MPFIPTPNAVQAELIYNWDSQICETVLDYVKASPWNSDSMAELAEGLLETWNANLKGSMPTTLSLIGVRVTDISSQTGPVVEQGIGLPSVGTAASPSLPNNVAIVFTKRTGLRGRSYRGRIYHPGLLESNVVGNTVDAVTAAALRSKWEAFLAIPLTVAADEALMVVVSRQNNNVPRAEGVATLVENLTTDGIVDSQRRRLPRRGA